MQQQTRNRHRASGLAVALAIVLGAAFVAAPLVAHLSHTHDARRASCPTHGDDDHTGTRASIVEPRGHDDGGTGAWNRADICDACALLALFASVALSQPAACVLSATRVLDLPEYPALLLSASRDPSRARGPPQA